MSKLIEDLLRIIRRWDDSLGCGIFMETIIRNNLSLINNGAGKWAISDNPETHVSGDCDSPYYEVAIDILEWKPTIQEALLEYLEMKLEQSRNNG